MWQCVVSTCIDHLELAGGLSMYGRPYTFEVSMMPENTQKAFLQYWPDIFYTHVKYDLAIWHSSRVNRTGHASECHQILVLSLNVSSACGPPAGPIADPRSSAHVGLAEYSAHLLRIFIQATMAGCCAPVGAPACHLAALCLGLGGATQVPSCAGKVVAPHRAPAPMLSPSGSSRCLGSGRSLLCPPNTRICAGCCLPCVVS